MELYLANISREFRPLFKRCRHDAMAARREVGGVAKNDFG